MQKIIKINDLYTILAQYSAKFIEEKVEAEELPARTLLRIRHALPEAAMEQLQALYEQVLARAEGDVDVWLTLEELAEYVTIIRTPELDGRQELFGKANHLTKANHILRHFAERDLLTEDVIARMNDTAQREQLLFLFAILERDWRIEYAINIPKLSQDEYFFLLDHPESALAVAMCFGIFAFQDEAVAKQLNAMLISAFDDVREHMQAIHCNCLEWVPYQNIRLPQQPLTRALDVFRNEKLSPEILRVMLRNLDVCEDYARSIVIMRKLSVSVGDMQRLLRQASEQPQKAYAVVQIVSGLSSAQMAHARELFAWDMVRLRSLQSMVNMIGTRRLSGEDSLLRLIAIIKVADRQALAEMQAAFRSVCTANCEELLQFRLQKFLQDNDIPATRQGGGNHAGLFVAAGQEIQASRREPSKLAYKNN